MFVRFPRPAVLSGREGAARFAQAGEIPLDVAVTRSLRALDPTITLGWVQETTGLHEPEAILRARVRTEVARPADVRTFFKSQLRRIVPTRTVTRPVVAVPVRTPPGDDPYG